MRIIFFGKATSRIGLQMLHMLEKYFPPEDIEIYQSTSALATLARRIHTSNQIGLFCISDHNELVSLVMMRDVVIHIHPVLILPYQDEALIALGHKLNPNFLFFAESDNQMIEAVVQAMAKSFLKKVAN